jgi:hypothetical protein
VQPPTAVGCQLIEIRGKQGIILYLMLRVRVGSANLKGRGACFPGSENPSLVKVGEVPSNVPNAEERRISNKIRSMGPAYPIHRPGRWRPVHEMTLPGRISWNFIRFIYFGYISHSASNDANNTDARKPKLYGEGNTILNTHWRQVR